jgi:choice-of-anchor B domain-containing protein
MYVFALRSPKLSLTGGMLCLAIACSSDQAPAMNPQLTPAGAAGASARQGGSTVSGAGGGAGSQAGSTGLSGGAGQSPPAAVGGSSGSTAGSSSMAGAPAASSDTDKDGLADGMDNCPQAANADQADSDADTVGNACDNCPAIKNTDQADADKNGAGDACACMNPKVACTAGMSGPYLCLGVDMLARVPLADLGARSGNAIWGGVESKLKREIAVVGLDNGTAFLDVSNPGCPVQLGRLPSTSSRSPTRDVKVLGDYALVVAEVSNHGMQIFDMRTLGTTQSTAMLTATAIYRGTMSATVGNAHDVAVNPATNMVYIVGARSCMGGLHMVDFKDPMNPKFVGCGQNTNYVHDAQCVIYAGPDKDHTGKELCVTFNGGNSFSVVDVTDKAAPKLISRTTYTGGVYSHNGALTEAHSHLVLSDELDESRNGNPTRTYLFDVTDLEKPVAMKPYDATTKAIDHNLFIRGKYVYQANYEAGLRILDASAVPMGGTLKEVAFFDPFPTLDAAELKGSWTAYPYFPSGIVVMQGTEGGVFILGPQREVVGAD